MTLTQLEEIKNQTYLLTVEVSKDRRVQIPVKIIDARASGFGRQDVKIAPLHGKGEQWVNFYRLKSTK